MRACLLIFVLVLAISGCAHVGVNSENYRGTILFFEGGDGTKKKNPSMFIYRTGYRLKNEGFIVHPWWLNFPNRESRLSDKHATDIQAKVDALVKEGHQNIWLMGISNGSLSVMNAACRNINNVSGYILVNPVEQIFRRLEIKNIDRPILLAIHEKDAASRLCGYNQDTLNALFRGSPNPKLVVFSGGRVGDTPEARGRTQYWQHGLMGLENEFVRAASDFINENRK